jgi:hypothetical protein
MDERASNVKIGKSDPTDNYAEIGPITAVDGSGCGLYGNRGTYNRAMVILKNEAYQAGGDYVQIITLTEPHLRGDCFANAYTINGTLFKKIAGSPSPLSIVEKSVQSGTSKIKELKSLLDDGAITKEEFDIQKRKVLESGM